MEFSSKIKKSINILFRGLVVIVTYLFIYREVFYKRDFNSILEILESKFESPSFLIQLSVIFVLLFVNWGVESGKWKIMIDKIEKVSLVQSFRAVMVGVSVGSFTPNRTGEYFGRVFMLKEGNHVEGVLITFISSISQLLVTLILGLFSTLYFVPNYIRIPEHLYNYIYFGMIVTIPILVFLLLIFYFNISILSTLLQKITPARWDKWRGYFTVFEWYNSGELLKVLLLSLLRYVVFSVQFYWLLRIFGLDIPFIPGMMIISVIYLAVTIVPTVALAEVGIRGSLSIYIIGKYLAVSGIFIPDYQLLVFSAATILWIINIVIPAIAGTFFVINMKLFRG